jgi:hypothetical protein
VNTDGDLERTPPFISEYSFQSIGNVTGPESCLLGFAMIPELLSFEERFYDGHRKSDR